MDILDGALMVINKLIVKNFKSHTYAEFQFGKINHFFGDNYTGKSSIGDAIVFCLFAVTKHGYKTYIKDYLQEGKSEMSVATHITIDKHTYKIMRTMNRRGAHQVFINDELTDDETLSKLVGHVRAFIYSFFPDIFPEEDAKVARSFLIEQICFDQGNYSKLEDEKRKLLKQQRELEKNKAFYAGQKLLLQKQLTEAERNRELDTSDQELVVTDNSHLQTEIETINGKIQEAYRVLYETKAKLKSYQQALKELTSSPVLLPDVCPTCQQSIPQEQSEKVAKEREERKFILQKEIEPLEIGLKNVSEQLGHYNEMKKDLESKLVIVHEKRQHHFDGNRYESLQKELKYVDKQLAMIEDKKIKLAQEIRTIKNELGMLANTYQKMINSSLTDVRIDLFKQLKNGEFRPQFQILYKERPYRVLSNSEKIRCMVEIITVFHQNSERQYPVFLDNLESITQLHPPKTQIITASVRKGMPLTLKVVE